MSSNQKIILVCILATFTSVYGADSMLTFDIAPNEVECFMEIVHESVDITVEYQV